MYQQTNIYRYTCIQLVWCFSASSPNRGIALISGLHTWPLTDVSFLMLNYDIDNVDVLALGDDALVVG